MLMMLDDRTHFLDFSTCHLMDVEIQGRSFPTGVVRGCRVRMRGGPAFPWSRHLLEVLVRSRHAVMEKRRLTKQIFVYKCVMNLTHLWPLNSLPCLATAEGSGMYGLMYFLPGLRDFRVSQYGSSKYSYGSILNVVSVGCQFVWLQDLNTLAANLLYLLFRSENWSSYCRKRYVLI